MNIEDKIKLFAELPDEERREVERYVEDHGDERPQLKAQLEESKRLGRLLEAARRLGANPPPEEAIAFYAVMRKVDRRRLPTDLAADFERLRERIDADPALQALLREYEARGEALSADSDAERQFRRLAGMDQDAAHESTRPSRRDRPTQAGRGRVFRRALAAAIAAAVIYALLFVGGRWARPDYERLAAFTSGELELEGYDAVRGPGGNAGRAAENGTRADGTRENGGSTTTTLYVRALEQLRAAETSDLGLFPRFRAEPLDSAASLLRRVIALEPEDSFLADEAHYFLGKTELARGNVAEAERELSLVAVSPGVRAEGARQLLQRVRALR